MQITYTSSTETLWSVAMVTRSGQAWSLVTLFHHPAVATQVAHSFITFMKQRSFPI